LTGKSGGLFQTVPESFPFTSQQPCRKRLKVIKGIYSYNLGTYGNISRKTTVLQIRPNYANMAYINFLLFNFKQLRWYAILE
jgi:hypothetical protein